MAWNLYDGHLIAQAGDKLPRATKKCTQFAISKCPPLLNYLGYTFCFSNVLAGPAFEYSTYLAAAEGTHLVDKAGKRRTPPRLYPVLWPLLQSLLSLAVFVTICPQVGECEERSDELRRDVQVTSTPNADTSVRNVAAANLFAVSYVMNTPPIATRFACRSSPS